jgi:hypothetical protein
MPLISRERVKKYKGDARYTILRPIQALRCLICDMEDENHESTRSSDKSYVLTMSTMISSIYKINTVFVTAIKIVVYGTKFQKFTQMTLFMITAMFISRTDMT